MTLVALLLATLVFALFGFATDEHHHRLTGRCLAPGPKRRFRVGAWLALALAFPPAIAAAGWIVGPILWSGLVMLGAGITFLVLNLVPRRIHAAARSNPKPASDRTGDHQA